MPINIKDKKVKNEKEKVLLQSQLECGKFYRLEYVNNVNNPRRVYYKPDKYFMKPLQDYDYSDFLILINIYEKTVSIVHMIENNTFVELKGYELDLNVLKDDEE